MGVFRRAPDRGPQGYARLTNNHWCPRLGTVRADPKVAPSRELGPREQLTTSPSRQNDDFSVG